MKKIILLMVLFTLPLYAHKETPVSHGRYVSGSKTVGSYLTFSGSLSFDRDDQTLDYTPRWEWDFEYNGFSFTPDISTQSSTVNHIYYKAGNFCFAVRYTDNDNQEGDIFMDYITIAGVNRYYYVKDHLGSVRMTLDESGTVISAQDYYPYGESLREYATGGNVNNKYKFTEKERDAETNYDYFGARYYDSKLGRWLSVDPHVDKYPGWSPYNYALNNPVNALDPNGKDVYLLVWATANGKIGHSGIAISNYTEINGVMTPNGTFTYYDFWPAPESGGAGKENFYKDIAGYYSPGLEVTLDELKNTDITGSEGYAADGILQLNTGFSIDQSVTKVLSDYRQNFKDYNGVNNNCSDYVRAGIETALGHKVGATEGIGKFKSTTPNKLFRAASKDKKSKIIKNPGKKINNNFPEGVTTDFIKEWLLEREIN